MKSDSKGSAQAEGRAADPGQRGAKGIKRSHCGHPEAYGTTGANRPMMLLSTDSRSAELGEPSG